MSVSFELYEFRMAEKSGSGEKLVAANRKAFHDYFILEKMEAGICLLGTEVKAIREGRINLKDSYAAVKAGEAYLLNCHISPYSHGNRDNHDPTRARKLLLHLREIRKLIGKTQEKGLTVVPLRVYLRQGRIKVELGESKSQKARVRRWRNERQHRSRLRSVGPTGNPRHRSKEQKRERAGKHPS